MKKRIVVVCPGRGSYTKETLGYLHRHGVSQKPFLRRMDELRTKNAEPTLTDLDTASQFKVSVHTKGEHASPLIYACAFVDFQSIDRDRFEVVAVCGNSMGWYLALSMAEALDWDGAFHVIQTMGSMMKGGLIGGQIIYPIVDENWIIDPEVEKKVLELSKSLGVYLSIRLGGYLVLAGEAPRLKMLMEQLPKRGDYPFQLINHGAFHTPLMAETSEKAFELIPQDLFHQPKVPLIDGEGRIWKPHGTDPERLRQYTLATQVTQAYDFSKSVEVALKEFAPDHLVLLGPGTSLGGSIGQVLVDLEWEGIVDKVSFQAQQKTSPILLSMGLEDQREVLGRL